MTSPADITDYDPREDFDRTRCDCERCVDACLNMPGGLIPQDLVRIADHLDVEDSEAWALENLQASPGAEVAHEGELCALPTIVPQSVESGACIFLKANRCTIHAIAPYGCSHLDMHMNRDESRRRSDAGLRSVAIDWATKGPYSRLWGVLWKAGKIAPPLEVRRAALQKAIENVNS
ncbi:MAG: YkgJ family cysteine cluster protein [Planctomycetes bacterium]|nr:YkgJ family cysteine cluster protein [Planctomycetota bacterium]